MTEMTFREYHELLMEKAKGNDIKEKLDIIKNNLNNNEEVQKSDLDSIKDTSSKIPPNKYNLEIIKSIFDKNLYTDEEKKTILNNLNREDITEHQKAAFEEIFGSNENQTKVKDQTKEVKDVTSDYQWLFNKYSDKIIEAASNIKGISNFNDLLKNNKDILKLLLISEIIGQKHLRTLEEAQKVDFATPFILFENKNYYLRLQGGNNKEKRSISIFESNNTKTRMPEPPARLGNFVKALNDLHQKASNAVKFRSRMSVYIDKKVQENIDINDNTEKIIEKDIDDGKVENPKENIISGGSSGSSAESHTPPTEEEKIKQQEEEKRKQQEENPNGQQDITSENKGGNYVSSAQRRGNLNLIRCMDLKLSDTKTDEGIERIEAAIKNTFGDNRLGSDGNPVNGEIFDRCLNRLQKRMNEMQSEEKSADARRKKTDDESIRKQYDSVKTESYSPIFKELDTNPLLKKQKEILNELYIGRLNLGRVSRNSRGANDKWKRESSDEGSLKKCQGNFLNKALKQFKELTDETNSLAALTNALKKLKKIEGDYEYEMQRRTTDIIRSNDYNIIGSMIQSGKDAKEKVTKDLDKDFENSRYGAMRKYEESGVLKAIDDNLMKFIEKGGEEATVISYASKNPSIAKDPVAINNGYEKIITNILMKNFYPRLKDRNDLVIHILKKINETAVKMLNDKEGTDESKRALIKSFFDKGTESYFQEAIKKLDPNTKPEEKVEPGKEDTEEKVEPGKEDTEEKVEPGKEDTEKPGSYSEKALEIVNKIKNSKNAEELKGIESEINEKNIPKEEERERVNKEYNNRYSLFAGKETESSKQKSYKEKIDSFRKSMDDADKSRDFDANIKKLHDLEGTLNNDFAKDKAQEGLRKELSGRISNNENLRKIKNDSGILNINSLNTALGNLKEISKTFENDEYFTRAMDMLIKFEKPGVVSSIMKLNKKDATDYLHYLKTFRPINIFRNSNISENYSVEEAPKEEPKTENKETQNNVNGNGVNTKNIETNTNYDVDNRKQDPNQLITQIISNPNLDDSKKSELLKRMLVNASNQGYYSKNINTKPGSEIHVFAKNKDNILEKLRSALQNGKNIRNIEDVKDNKFVYTRVGKNSPIIAKPIGGNEENQQGDQQQNQQGDQQQNQQGNQQQNQQGNQQQDTPEEKKKKNSIFSFFNGLKKSAIQKSLAKLQTKMDSDKDRYYNNKNIEKAAKLQSKLQQTSVLTFEDNFLLCVPLLEDDDQNQEVQVRTADAEKAVLMALSMDQQTSAQGKKWIVDNMYKGNPEAEKLVDEFIKQNTKDRAKADQALRGNQKVAPGPGGNPTGQQPQQNGQQPNVNQPQQQAQPNPNGQQQPAVTNPAAPAMPQQAMANQQQPNPNGAPQQATVTTGAADGYPNRLYKKLIRRKIGM